MPANPLRAKNNVGKKFSLPCWNASSAPPVEAGRVRSLYELHFETKASSDEWVPSYVMDLSSETHEHTILLSRTHFVLHMQHKVCTIHHSRFVPRRAG